MTKIFILLTGYLLFGQPTYSVAQKDVQLQRCCEKIMKVGPCLAFTGDHNGKMRFRLLGIYSHGPTLFFLLRLNNRSPLDYTVDSIRFCIMERGRNQPAAALHPLPPVFIYENMARVPRYQRFTTIYALPRFTLPPGSRLLIVIREKSPVPGQNRGRDLRIQTADILLRRARLI